MVHYSRGTWFVVVVAVLVAATVVWRISQNDDYSRMSGVSESTGANGRPDRSEQNVRIVSERSASSSEVEETGTAEIILFKGPGGSPVCYRDSFGRLVLLDLPAPGTDEWWEASEIYRSFLSGLHSLLMSGHGSGLSEYHEPTEQDEREAAAVYDYMRMLSIRQYAILLSRLDPSTQGDDVEACWRRINADSEIIPHLKESVARVLSDPYQP